MLDKIILGLKGFYRWRNWEDLEDWFNLDSLIIN